MWNLREDPKVKASRLVPAPERASEMEFLNFSKMLNENVHDGLPNSFDESWNFIHSAITHSAKKHLP
jgi:hypothetical protein